MAVGDVTLFNRFYQDIGLEIHQLETDTIQVGFVDNTTTPTASTADPRWGSGGSTDFSANEVTPGGNYSSGGPTIANNTYAESAGVATFDGDNISITQDASNPDSVWWGIIYNSTAAGNQAIGFIELGSGLDLSTGDFSITWNASGIFTLQAAA